MNGSLRMTESWRQAGESQPSSLYIALSSYGDGTAQTDDIEEQWPPLKATIVGQLDAERDENGMAFFRVRVDGAEERLRIFAETVRDYAEVTILGNC